MVITLEQRLKSLERELLVVKETLKVLHKMLKEQRLLINEYIIQKVISAPSDEGGNGGNGRPEDVIYTFVCKKRMDKLDKDIDKMRKLVNNLKLGEKVS